MQLGRKLGYPAQAVGNTGHGVAVLGQPFNKTILLAAFAPAATVYPHNQSRSFRFVREIQVKLQALTLNHCKFDILNHLARCGCIGRSGEAAKQDEAGPMGEGQIHVCIKKAPPPYPSRHAYSRTDATPKLVRLIQGA